MTTPQTARVAPVLLVLLCAGCANGLFYYPDRVQYQTPAEHGLEYEKVTFRSRDDTRLTGWFVPAVGKPIGTVIHFHGNAQNMTAHFGFVQWLPAEGFNLFVFDYRGYGESEGKPAGRGVYEDSVAAIKYVQSRPDLDQGKLLILGQSLGGANAIAAVAGHRFDGVRAIAIESTFYSYRSVARDKIAHMPLLSWARWPLSFLVVTNGHSPGPIVARLAPTPLLLIHGTADRVIACRHSRRLYERAKEPKALWMIEGGRHTEAFTRFGSTYREKLVEFYDGALNQGASHAPGRASATLPEPEAP